MNLTTAIQIDLAANRFPGHILMSNVHKRDLLCIESDEVLPSSEAEGMMPLDQSLWTYMCLLRKEPLRLEVMRFRIQVVIVVNGPDIGYDCRACTNIESFIRIVVHAMVRGSKRSERGPTTMVSVRTTSARSTWYRTVGPL